MKRLSPDNEMSYEDNRTTEGGRAGHNFREREVREGYGAVQSEEEEDDHRKSGGRTSQTEGWQVSRPGGRRARGLLQEQAKVFRGWMPVAKG